MPKYRIFWDYGYMGTDNEDFIEATNLEEAQEISWETAIQGVSSSAEEISEEEYEENA